MPSHWTTRQIHLFGGGSQVENFREMSTIYPVRVIRRSSRPVPLRSGPSIELPFRFAFEGREMDTAEFLADMETTGLVVVKDDRLVFERYWLGNDEGIVRVTGNRAGFAHPVSMFGHGYGRALGATTT